MNTTLFDSPAPFALRWRALFVRTRTNREWTRINANKNRNCGFFIGRLFAVALAFALTLATGGLYASDFQKISDDATPEVAIETTIGPDASLKIRLQVEPLYKDFPAPLVRLAIAAHQVVLLDSRNNASITRPTADAGTGAGADAEAGADNNGRWVYEFVIPTGSRDGASKDLRFRRALAVEWTDQKGNAVVCQNFFVPSSRPVFSGLGTDAGEWEQFSMADHLVARRVNENRIKLPFVQPVDGKASIVIEDADGRRVRNLLSGKTMAAGTHEVEWDGLDENGHMASPGNYTWRAISHPGIKPELLMWFYNPGTTPWDNSRTSSWLADHSNPSAAASNGDRIVLGAPIAESGNNIILLDLDGRKLAHGNMSWSVGRGVLQLAISKDRFFALSEGSLTYGHTAQDKDGKSYVRGELVLLAWDFSGNRKNYDGQHGSRLIRAYRKPAEEVTGYYKAFHIGNLRGALWLDGRLYVSLYNENCILLLDPERGTEVGKIEVSGPGPIATDGQSIYGVGKDNRVFRIDNPGNGAAASVEWLFDSALSKPLPVVDEYGAPWVVATGAALTAHGELLIADNGVDQNIKVYRLPEGKLVREIGTRGGRAARGPWDGNAIRMPSGIAVDGRDRLWLTENEPTPKRVSVWDMSTGKLDHEYFGPTAYGAPGAGFDPEDASRWLGAGMVWKVDFGKKNAVLESVLHHQVRPGQMTGPGPGHSGDIPDGLDVQIIHRDGRTFFITKGRYLRIFELLRNGGARLWALLGTLESFQSTPPRWAVPEVFTRHPDLKDELASFTETTGSFGDLRNSTAPSPKGREYIILWIDRNGDEVGQVEEMQVSRSDTKVAVPYWTLLNQSLDLEMPIQKNTTWMRATLRLQGFLPSGAPDWDLQKAYDEAIPLKNYTPTNLQGSLADNASGRLIFNASPFGAVDADGSLRWTMRNDWAGLHASHLAPLPEEGVVQGPLAFLGLAPFDKEGGITVLNGNHGRFFALTTDGIYLDEFFEDVRVSLRNSPLRIGGEPFGGHFGYDRKQNRYLLQAAHGAFKIYELHGMDRLLCSQGTLLVTPDQMVAAQKLQEARTLKENTPKEIQVRNELSAAIDLGKSPDNWPVKWLAEWGGGGTSGGIGLAPAQKSCARKKTSSSPSTSGTPAPG
jgi:hypothetical protein